LSGANIEDGRLTVLSRDAATKDEVARSAHWSPLPGGTRTLPRRTNVLVRFREAHMGQRVVTSVAMVILLFDVGCSPHGPGNGAASGSTATGDTSGSAGTAGSGGAPGSAGGSGSAGDAGPAGGAPGCGGGASDD